MGCSISMHWIVFFTKIKTIIRGRMIVSLNVETNLTRLTEDLTLWTED